jgi:hypothetical protein
MPPVGRQLESVAHLSIWSDLLTYFSPNSSCARAQLLGQQSDCSYVCAELLSIVTVKHVLGLGVRAPCKHDALDESRVAPY